MHLNCSFSVYRLQQEAPLPIPVLCKNAVPNCPSYYGSEFHGVMSHLDASALLTEDGCYLVRQSGGANGFYTLSLRYVFDFEYGYHFHLQYAK